MYLHVLQRPEPIFQDQNWPPPRGAAKSKDSPRPVDGAGRAVTKSVENGLQPELRAVVLLGGEKR